MPGITLRQIRAVIAVCEEGSFTRAAEREAALSEREALLTARTGELEELQAAVQQREAAAREGEAALAELETEVEVPEDVPLLGIRAGRYDVQRLLYWHVAKLFWNPKLTLEENNHVNFDWYAPTYAWRQTEDEVRRWCAEERLEIEHFDAQEAGFTVRAVRR